MNKKDIKLDIKDLKDGTSVKISDHETRINKLESASTRMAVMLSVGIFALTFLISLIAYHILGK